MSEQAVDDGRGREAARSRKLVGQGHLLWMWMWMLPALGRAYGLWRA